VGAGLRRGWWPAALAALAGLAGLAGASATQAIELRFEADLRAEIAAGRFDPARDGVGLRGGCAPLSWQRSLPMPAVGDGRYALTLRLDDPACGGQPLPHKFRIERPGQGADAGWEPGRNHAAFVDGAGPVRIARVFGAEAPPPPAHIVGTLVELDAVPARHVTPRPVQVWLPPGYERDTDRRYPVLYLHDGQNVFDARAAGAEWQVDETAQRLVLAGTVQPFIVVAVPSGRDRIAELTPTPGVLTPERSGQPAPRKVGGGAAAYARYLVEDLKPAIDARFRTQPGPQSTAVGGSSLGGLASLWLALHHGDTFGAALVVSPSVWWDDEFARRDVSTWSARSPSPRPRLWLDIGDQEGEGAVPAVRRLRDALIARGWTPQTLAYTEAPGARHDEASWALRVEGMLRFLHGPAQPAAR
jgi:predicted alpha/beta superfamily hydrolase